MDSPPSSRAWSRRTLLAAGSAVVVGSVGSVGSRASAAPPPWPQTDWALLPGSSVLGLSTQGRPIHVVRRTGSAPVVTVLVVGTIHGHEPLGSALAAVILAPEFVLPDWLDLHVIPVANPDGLALRRRQNGAGIDLNRDGLVRWRRKPLDGGPAGLTPESQPETQLVLGHARSMPTPHLSIWVHQFLSWVAPVSTPTGVPLVAKEAAKAYRRLARLPNRRTGSTSQSGGWETTAAFDVGPAILVEGAGFRWPTPLALSRHASGFMAAIDTIPRPG